MSAKWKEQALQAPPELKEEIEEAENAYQSWFIKNDVIAMKEIFSCCAGEEGYQKILQVYDRKSR